MVLKENGGRRGSPGPQDERGLWGLQGPPVMKALRGTATPGSQVLQGSLVPQGFRGLQETAWWGPQVLLRSRDLQASRGQRAFQVPTEQTDSRVGPAPQDRRGPVEKWDRWGPLVHPANRDLHRTVPREHKGHPDSRDLRVPSALQAAPG